MSARLGVARDLLDKVTAKINDEPQRSVLTPYEIDRAMLAVALANATAAIVTAETLERLVGDMDRRWKISTP